MLEDKFLAGEMSMMKNKHYLFKLTINVSRSVDYLYTAKLITTMLITTLPRLLEPLSSHLLVRTKACSHFTFLINSRNGKTNCIYNYDLYKSREFVECHTPSRLDILEANYHFYFGFHTQYSHQRATGQ